MTFRLLAIELSVERGSYDKDLDHVSIARSGIGIEQIEQQQNHNNQKDPPEPVVRGGTLDHRVRTDASRLLDVNISDIAGWCDVEIIISGISGESAVPINFDSRRQSIEAGMKLGVNGLSYHWLIISIGGSNLSITFVEGDDGDNRPIVKSELSNSHRYSRGIVSAGRGCDHSICDGISLVNRSIGICHRRRKS